MKYIKALGLDVGRKRIGIAACDRLGLFAYGLTTIYRQSWLKDTAQLAVLIKERDIDTLVVGMPYNMDGSKGAQAKQVEKYALRLSQHFAISVYLVDERLTSFSAEENLKAMGYNLRANKALIDQQSAVIILQQWLDSLRHRACENAQP
jgi:putative Holliday junction resolvase